VSAPATASQIVITLPDGKTLTFPRGVTGGEIAAAIGPGLAKAALILEVPAESLDIRDGIVIEPHKNRSISLRELANTLAGAPLMRATRSGSCIVLTRRPYACTWPSLKLTSLRLGSMATAATLHCACTREARPFASTSMPPALG